MFKRYNGKAVCLNSIITKKKINELQRNYVAESKIDYLRSLNQIKNGATSFVMGYPVELGYINRKDLQEINSANKISLTTAEKEDGINEVANIVIKWACVLFHLVATLLVVYKYDKALMISILIGGFIIMLIVLCVIMLLIKNIEIFEIVLKELRKRNLSTDK